MPLIEIQEVSKVYGFGDATTLALDEVFLSVEKGEFVAFMGPSGSGKTTLMNIIGLLDRPSHGEYLLENRKVSSLRTGQQAKLRRDRIGFVFQFYNLMPRLNVLENVALPLAYKGMMPVRRNKRAADMLERVGMLDREYYLPRQLSGGQIQRAAIARALINEPGIIIADEPTGNLDSHDSRVVMELLSDIHRQGNTILLVTHNPELTRYAQRVIYMSDGMIVGDEKSAIGQVAKKAKYTYYKRRRRTITDIAAGVSAIMRDVLNGDTPPAKTRKPTTRRRAPRKRTARRKR